MARDEILRRLPDLAAEHGALRGDYVVFGEIVTAVLEQAARGLGIACIVQARAKETASVVGKVLRKPKYVDCVAKMTDLCGVRVITECGADVEPICEFIRKQFVIDEANSEDKRAGLGTERFGYLSVHYIVSFRPGEFSDQVGRLAARLPDEGAREAFLASAARIGAIEVPGSGAANGELEYKAEIQVRTLLQHAWAAIAHDRLYKSEFDVPEHLTRQSNRAAAILEEADRLLDQTIREVDMYTNYFGAYMGPDEMRDRVRESEAALRHEEGESAKLRAARRIARLAAWLKDWDAVIRALGQCATNWRYSAAGKSLADDVAAVLDNDRAGAYERENALALRAELRDPGCASCLIDYGKALWAKGDLTGRQWLAWATHLDPQSVDAWVELGDTYLQEQRTALAREHYQRAVAISSNDPRALQRLVLCVLRSGGDGGTVCMFAGYLRGAINVCRTRAAAHVYLPHALYDIGLFHLVLDEPYEALEAYAAGVLGSRTIEPIGEALSQLTAVRDNVERRSLLHVHLDWVLRFLSAAKVAKAKLLLPAAREEQAGRRGAVKDAEQALADAYEAAREDAAAALGRARESAGRVDDVVTELEAAARPANLRNGPLGDLVIADWRDEAVSIDGRPVAELPILMVAGGCRSRSAAQIDSYRDLVYRAFDGWQGVVFGGGTKSGVSGLTGDLPGGPLLKVAYQPRYRSEGTQLYREAYHKVVDSGGEVFSPREPLQCWIDILAAGVDPCTVRLLGINGGRTSAVEYRMALALGAQVGLLSDSGRAVTDLLNDPLWMAAPSLLPLPSDAQTLWFFFHAVPRAAVLSSADRESLASAEHEAYVVDRAKSLAPGDAALRPWPKLPDALRASTQQKVDALELKLQAAGLELVYVGPGQAATNQPSAAQVQIMREIEHGRWNHERLTSGWRHGPRDHQQKTSPYLVPWTDPVLDSVRQYDWDDKTPQRLADLGYEIRPRNDAAPLG